MSLSRFYSTTWLLLLVLSCSLAQSSGAVVMTEYTTSELQQLGKTSTNEKILLGGFSGLRFTGQSEDGSLNFVTHTDQGPILKKIKKTGQRPFALPELQISLFRLTLNLKTKNIAAKKTTSLTSENAKNINGLPSKEYEEIPISLASLPIEPNSLGIDPEGIALDNNGNYWIVEEYNPWILEFSSSGKLLRRFTTPNKGVSSKVDRTLIPEVIERRQTNKGFEGVALRKDKVFAITQSSLRPSNENKKNRLKKFARLVVIDTKKEKLIGTYLYPFNDLSADKISDLHALPNGEILALERDGRKGPKSSKKIYAFRWDKATNLQTLSEEIQNKVDHMPSKKLKKLNIRPLHKRLVFDLNKNGYPMEKPEGLAVIDKNQIAIINDNDFGLTGKRFKKTGKLKRNKTPTKVHIFKLETSLY